MAGREHTENLCTFFSVCYEPNTALKKKQSLLKKKKKNERHAWLVPEIAKKPLWFLSSGREGWKERQGPGHVSGQGKKCENAVVWRHLVSPNDLSL